MTYRFLTSAKSDKGKVRASNQDSGYSGNNLFIVADGMGGHSAGDIASQTIITALANLSKGGASNTNIFTLTSILEDVNEQLVAQNVEHERMAGSTIAVAFATGKNCTCLWAGDTRIYLYRRQRLLQLSTDHSQLQELLAQGEITPEQANLAKLLLLKGVVQSTSGKGKENE